MKKLQYLWEYLNASFWFIPMLMLLITIGYDKANGSNDNN